jgi:hypothetical protein
MNALCQGSHRVRRIGETVKQQRPAAGVGRRQDRGAIPVGIHPGRIGEAAGGITVQFSPILRGNRAIDLFPKLGEKPVLEPPVVIDRLHTRDIGSPEFGIERCGMPTLKLRVTPKINDVDGDERDDDAEYCIRQEQTKMFQHAHVHSPASGLKPLRD